MKGLDAKSTHLMMSMATTFPLSLDERQITHLICARLKYDLYDFF